MMKGYEFAQNVGIDFLLFLKNKDSLPYVEKNENDIMQNSEFLDGLSLKAKKLVVSKIVEQKKGSEKNLSSERLGYIKAKILGCPIPIIYTEDGKISTVEESELPVTLPEDIDLSQNGNPFDNHPTWKFVNVKKQTQAIRETIH